MTAIELAGTDDNPETDADPAWTPLLVTPGIRITLPVTPLWPVLPGTVQSDALAMTGVVRSFPNFSAMMSEVVDARVLGGIHFRTADTDGEVMGIAVTRYVLDHAFLPCK